MIRTIWALAFCVVLVGCSDDDENPPATRPAVCVEIQEACHEADKTQTGDIHECHENAESTWTQAQCEQNKSSCLALCAAGEDGGTDAEVTDGDAAPSDGASEGAIEVGGDASPETPSEAGDAATETGPG